MTRITHATLTKGVIVHLTAIVLRGGNTAL
jgi:hypothetical protein